MPFKCIDSLLKMKSSSCSRKIDHSIYHSCGTNKFTDAFDDYLNYFKEPKNKVEYLILMENPLSFGTYVYNKHAPFNGTYNKPINIAFAIDETKDRLIQWQKKGILVVVQIFFHRST